jgi:hypothetical protein
MQQNLGSRWSLYIDLQFPILVKHLIFFKIQQNEMNFFFWRTTLVYVPSSDWWISALTPICRGCVFCVTDLRWEVVIDIGGNADQHCSFL